jgi:2'-5' RNA ligase
MDDIRSFIALEIPPALKSRLEELQRELRRIDADVKWVRSEGIHLTLKFLGSIRKEDIEKISLAVGPLISGWEPIEVGIRGMGCFPSTRNPRVVWVGIDRGKSEVSSLQRAVEKGMRELSFPPENRPFSPHLTLGRVRSPQGKVALARVVEDNKDAEVGTFLAQGVFLFQSELKPSGAVYTKLREFEMKEQKKD